MPRSNIIPAKYVFLDVVQYTKKPIEAQCDVIRALNDIVKDAIGVYEISDDLVIYIPTGDGICIVLLSGTLQFDIHMKVALEILGGISSYNAAIKDERRKFEVRVGINQGEDNIVTDINGMKNVAGSGINDARRIMDLADGGQILVSRLVYEVLHQREEYLNSFVEFTAQVKHGRVLDVYQFVPKGTIGLNVNTPSSLIAATPEPEPKLPQLTAYYFAHSIKNEKFILDKAREEVVSPQFLKLLLWFLAKESEERASRSPYDIYGSIFMPDGSPDTIEEQFEWFYEEIPGQVALQLSWLTLDDAVPSPMQYDYFEGMTQDLVLNSKGKEKLKKDWPEIWDEFELGELQS